MEKIIEEIASQFNKQLPEGNAYYSLEEMQECDFPSFLLRRVYFKLKCELDDSVEKPETKWSNTQAEKVDEAWRFFWLKMLEEIRLPAEQSQNLLEEAVSDVLKLLMMPRKRIPQILFKQDKPVTVGQLEVRSEEIVVNSHFVSVLKRYMQRKSLDELSKQKGEEIIRKADDKITENYSPPNWTQLLEPLFKLAAGQLDAELLHLFFEDKNMPEFADKFHAIDARLSRAEVIEVLSSPELLDVGKFQNEEPKQDGNQSARDDEELTAEADQNEEGGGEPKYENPKAENTDEGRDLTKEEISEEGSDADQQKETVEDQEKEAKFNNENKNHQKEEDTHNDKDEAEDEAIADEDTSLNASFAQSKTENSEDKKTLGEMEGVQESRSASQHENPAENNASDINPDIEPKRTPPGREESDNEELENEHIEEERDQKTDSPKIPDGNEKPVWMRFMSDDEKEQYREQEQGSGDLEPVINLTNQAAANDQKTELEKLFADDPKRFKEHLFDGSSHAFDDALENLASFEDWQVASTYIDIQIFSKNKVDMYSETAVEFTDRLHDYFLDH